MHGLIKVLGIDHRLQERFAKVQSVILQWVLEAERQCRGRAEGSDLSALNTALRWERLAPAIFLRPPRRGNGSIAVGGRIDRFLAGDYEVLVAEYLRDLLRNHRRQVHFVDIQGSANALRERTLRKILDNRDWSRAVRALSSNGLGDLDHPQVQAELLAKHPQEREHWPPEIQAPLGAEVRLENMRKILSQLDVNAASGPDGMPNAVLRGFTRDFNDPDARLVVERLQHFGDLVANGRLPR